MGIIKEFKEFAMRGNVIDLAVGVIIGAASGKIVTSLVNDIIMPPLGKVMGGIDFGSRFLYFDPVITLADGSPLRTLFQAQEAGAPVIAYGHFINSIIDLLISAFCIFFLA